MHFEEEGEGEGTLVDTVELGSARHVANYDMDFSMLFEVFNFSLSS